MLSAFQTFAGTGKAGVSPPTVQTYYAVWDTTQGKEQDNDNGDQINVGCQFSLYENGFVYGVRVLKLDAAGTLTASLYDAGSSPIAQATYSTAGTGWVVILFAAPVAVTTGVTYTAACFVPKHYGSTSNVNPHVIGDVNVASSCYDDTNSVTKPTTVFNFRIDYMVSPLFSLVGNATVALDRATLFEQPALASGQEVNTSNTGAFAAHYSVWPAGVAKTSNCDNDIIEGYLVTAEIAIGHNNVTVRNCIVQSDSPNYGIHPDATGPTRTGYDIRFNTVSSTYPDGGSYGIGCHDGTVYRNQVSGFENFFSIGQNIQLIENYGRVQGTNPLGHNDGIECNGGANSSWLRNYITNSREQTTAMTLNSRFGAVSNYLIDGNFFASNTNYCVQMTADVSFPFDSASIVFTNNVVVSGISGAYYLDVGDPVVIGPTNTTLPNSDFPP